MNTCDTPSWWPVPLSRLSPTDESQDPERERRWTSAAPNTTVTEGADEVANGVGLLSRVVALMESLSYAQDVLWDPVNTFGVPV